MLSLNTTKYSPPLGYQVSEFPSLLLEDRNDVIIKVHAASISPIEVKKASGVLKMGLEDKWECSINSHSNRNANHTTRFPYKIGYDCAGIVAEIGAGVSHIKVSDEV